MEKERVAVFIPCFHTDDFLDKVVKQFMHWGTVLILSYDFGGKMERETEVRNEGLKRLQDFDFVWTVDGDELITKNDQERIIAEMRQNNCGAGVCRTLDYFALDRAIFEETTPTVIVKPQKVCYYEGRCLRTEGFHGFNDVWLHHFGRMMPPEKMAWKLKTVWEQKDDDYSHPKQERMVTVGLPEEFKKLFGEKL